MVPDSFYTDVPMLERRKRESDDEVMRAIYASVLGELYDGNARRNRNYGHTEAHPDSLREWSYNQFKAASAENFRQSMAHPELLAEVKAADFIPFVEKGRDAAYFNGDLLNVIVRRAVNNLSGKANECHEQKAAWYGSTLRVYRNKGNRQAELLMMLDSVDEANESSDFHLPVSPYKAEPTEADVERRVLASGQYRTYTEMLDKFGDLPLSAEIYIAMTELPVTPALQVKWAEGGHPQISCLSAHGYAQEPRGAVAESFCQSGPFFPTLSGAWSIVRSLPPQSERGGAPLVPYARQVFDSGT